MLNYLLLEEVDSTNSYVSAHSGELDDMTMVIAGRQTAGRGQRGNSWESQPGMNLTFTLFHTPNGMKARDQFSISEAVALAMADTLREYGIDAKVKWPNDIYVDDFKICGILIENTLLGDVICNTRIGAGLNVNQLEFLSDAPNPVSMACLTGESYDISRVAASAGMHLEQRLAMVDTSMGRDALHHEFMRRLWRGDGAEHPFRRRSDGEVFPGVIKNVSPAGPIEILDTATGCTSIFAFKEVEFLI